MTLIICKKPNCIHSKEVNPPGWMENSWVKGEYKCGCDAIGIDRDLHCDSFLDDSDLDVRQP